MDGCLLLCKGLLERMDGLPTCLDAVELCKIVNSGNFGCVLL
jgi:hypothetical protein